MSWRRVLAVLVAVVGLAACGSPSSDSMNGSELARDLGCVSCHTQVDTAQAPTWEGLAGSTVILEDGSSVVADAEYIRRSIAEPAAQVVQGYRPTMPTFDLTPEQIDLLVEHIMGLGS